MRFVCSADFMKPFLVVRDYNFYLDNEQDIIDWCNNCVPGWEIVGMIIYFKSEQDRLAFLLRWE